MENFKAVGYCSLCNSPLEFKVGEYIMDDRWRLLAFVTCHHCKEVLFYILRDSCGRFWGRKRLFND